MTKLTREQWLARLLGSLDAYDLSAPDETCKVLVANLKEEVEALCEDAESG